MKTEDTEIIKILDDALNLSRRLIKERPEIHYWEKPSLKGQKEIVTSLDLEIEKNLVDKIGSAIPEAYFFVEENHHNISELQKEKCFIIDPIDGTTNFISGSSDYSISIALARHREIILGVLDFPSRNERLWGEKHHGAHNKGGQIRVSKQDDLHKFRIAVSPSLPQSNAWELIKKKLPNAEFITIGALTPKVSTVATGGVDAAFYLSGSKQSFVVWDYAAAGLILEESGGKFTSLSGENIMNTLPFHSKGGWLASNSLRHSLLLESINEILDKIGDS